MNNHYIKYLLKSFQLFKDECKKVIKLIGQNVKKLKFRALLFGYISLFIATFIITIPVNILKEKIDSASSSLEKFTLDDSREFGIILRTGQRDALISIDTLEYNIVNLLDYKKSEFYSDRRERIIKRMALSVYDWGSLWVYENAEEVKNELDNKLYKVVKHEHFSFEEKINALEELLVQERQDMIARLAKKNEKVALIREKKSGLERILRRINAVFLFFQALSLMLLSSVKIWEECEQKN